MGSPLWRRLLKEAEAEECLQKEKKSHRDPETVADTGPEWIIVEGPEWRSAMQVPK